MGGWLLINVFVKMLLWLRVLDFAVFASISPLAIQCEPGYIFVVTAEALSTPRQHSTAHRGYIE